MNNTEINTAYIGLGSNLEEPLLQIERAISSINRLQDTEINHISSYYKSQSIGPGKQPDYINAVVALRTTMDAESLLDQLQNIENEQGRERGPVRWTARTLDLDILLFNQDVMATERLTVPHPELKNRNFVLFPLLDVAPDLTLPDGASLLEVANTASLDGIARLKI